MANRSKIISLTSELVKRMGLGAAGLRFGGKRDYWNVLGYENTITFQNYLLQYTRGGIAKRIVTAPVKGTWRIQPMVVEGKLDEEITPFENAWMDLATRLKAHHYFARVDKLAGIGQFGVLIIGTRRGSLDQPLTIVSGPEDITYLAAYSQQYISIDSIVTDSANPRFGLPEFYKISSKAFNQPGTKMAVPVVDKLIHHSRVIHVAENTLDGEIYGEPRLQCVFNLLDDLIKVTGGSAEAFWLVANRGMQINVDGETELAEEDAKKLSDEVEEFQHQLRRFIRTKGVEIHPLGGEGVDPRGAFEVIISLIAGASEIPRRILLGSESGELASSQDRSNWNERLYERRTQFAEPIILRPFIDRMIAIQALPTPKEPYKIIWDDMLGATEQERAGIAVRIGAALRNFEQQSTVTRGEFRERWLRLPRNIPVTDQIPGKGDKDPEEEEKDDDVLDA